MLCGIEIHDIRIAQFMAVFTRQQAGSIVAADLHVACSTWSSAVLFTVYGNGDRLDAVFEISTHGRAINNQQSILGRFDPQSGSRTEHDGTQIERCAGTIGRNIFFVAFNHFDAGLDDHFDRRDGKAKTFRRRLQPLGVLLYTEKTDFPIDTPKGFQPFEQLDTVMQTRRRHVYLDILVARDLHLTPFAVRIIIANVCVGLAIIESQGTPIHIFHYNKF